MTENVSTNDEDGFSDKTEKEINRIIKELSDAGVTEEEFANSLPHPLAIKRKEGMTTEESVVYLMEGIKNVLINKEE